MHRSSVGRTLWVALALLTVAACSQPPTPSSPQAASAPSGGASATTPAQPKGTIRVAWTREPETLSPKFLSGGGAGEYTWTFNSALAIRDLSYIPHPMLARELPSQANGDWVVNADGTMVTTFRLRDNARWHDGAPYCSGQNFTGTMILDS